MVQVDIEVRTGAARFRVTARARSIHRAVSLAGAGYPGAEVRLVVPVEEDSFFVEDAPDKAEFVGFRMPEAMAG